MGISYLDTGFIPMNDGLQVRRSMAGQKRRKLRKRGKRK